MLQWDQIAKIESEGNEKNQKLDKIANLLVLTSKKAIQN